MTNSFDLAGAADAPIDTASDIPFDPADPHATRAFHPENTPRWMYVDLNCFFASVEQHLDPSLRDKPVGVVPILANGGAVIAACRVAKRHGIKVGTRVAEARELCPGIVFREARHDVYVKIHRQIKAVIERHVPVYEAYSIDDFVCALKANEAEPERAFAIARALKADLAKTLSPAITCSIGFGPNRFLAKVATELQKPDGLILIRADELPGRLDRLDLSDLPGVGKGMSIRLKKVGIKTIDDLWRCSPKQLRAIWHNVEGERLWYRLHGYPVPEDYNATGKMIGHSHILPLKARVPANARPIARRLAQKAGSRLRRHKKVAGVLDLSVRFIDGRHWAGSWMLGGVHDVKALTQAVDHLWERMVVLENVTPDTRLKKVAVMLHQLSPMSAVQGELFAPSMLQPPLPGQLSPHQTARNQPSSRQPAVSQATRPQSGLHQPVPNQPAATRPRPTEKNRERAEKLSGALDALNQRFGQDTVSFGHLPVQTAPYVGAKIAFNRIPDDFDFRT
ncbi:MAG: hypothetical protein AAF213_09405 [Pseudomonadota bacterium]